MAFIAFRLSSCALLALLLAHPSPAQNGGTPEAGSAAICYADAGLRVMNDDGSAQTLIVRVRGAEEVRGPCWSPDGQRIVFWGNLGGSKRIYAVSSTGGGLTSVAPMIDTGLGSIAYPDWSPTPSPDGNYKIVYTDYGVPGFRDVYVVNPDGSEPRKPHEHADRTSPSPAGRATAGVSRSCAGRPNWCSSTSGS